MTCGHDTKWLAYRNPVDVGSGVYCVFCEMERLQTAIRNIQSCWAAYMKDGRDAVVFDELAKSIQETKP